MNIGSSIKEIRKRRKLSQVELAEYVGISQTALSQIERGATVPTKKSLTRICEALDIPPALLYFMGIDETDVPADRKVIFDALYPAFKNLAIQILGSEKSELLT